MTRNMIEANAGLFRNLTDYCANRGAPIPTAAEARWIKSDESDKRYLQRATLVESLSFGRRKFLVHVVQGEEDWLAAVGFESELDLAELEYIEVNDGLAVCLAFELSPLPVANPVEIREAVEFSSQADPEYCGHEWASVAALLPRIQLTRCRDSMDEETIWVTFFSICLDECQFGESWIGDTLASEVLRLTDVRRDSFPFHSICQSLLDFDPRSLFMALYRCIESTYAYENCTRIVDRLQLSISWMELAETLQAEASWRPMEAESLIAMLYHADPVDLASMGRCLGVQVSAQSVGNAIYRLRNSIVHFRPGMPAASHRTPEEWNELCASLARIARSVYAKAYGPHA